MELPTSKLKHGTMWNRFEEGDLKSIDMSTKTGNLHCSWIRQLLENEYHEWKLIPLCLIISAFGLGLSLNFILIWILKIPVLHCFLFFSTGKVIYFLLGTLSRSYNQFGIIKNPKIHRYHKFNSFSTWFFKYRVRV